MNSSLPAPSPLNEPANIAAFLRETGLLRAEAAGAGIAPDDIERIEQAAKENNLKRQARALGKFMEKGSQAITVARPKG